MRAQEESVDALSLGSLFVGVRSATQSIMASMRSVGMVGKDMVRSSSHTITIITQTISQIKSPSSESIPVFTIHKAFKSRINDYNINSPLRLPKVTSYCIDDPANFSVPSRVTGRIRCRTHASRL